MMPAAEAHKVPPNTRCAACGRPIATVLWNPRLGGPPLCAYCYPRFAGPIAAWRNRWIAACVVLAAGFVVVCVGAAGERIARVGHVVSMGHVAIGLAVMLLGVALRPSYRRPPDPPPPSDAAQN